MSTERPTTEEGSALVATLLAILILSAITVVMSTLAMTESRATGSSRDFETAVHAAESGADRLIPRLNDNASYQTGHVRTAGAVASPQAERQWAIDQFEAAQADPGATSSATLLQTPAGPAFGIRPTDSLGNRLDVLYGVAEVASGEGSKIRVVKMAYDRGFYVPKHALFVGCHLTINGSPTISGSQGNVHTNCNLALTGSPTVSGAATATGTATLGGSVGAGSGGGRPLVPPPTISARGVYTQRFAYAGSGGATYDGTWFDLCPDGTVRPPAASGALPCSSLTVLHANDGDDYRGWKMSGNDWVLSGNQGYSGVYYVYRRSAKISGHPGFPGTRPAMTVIAEANPNDGPGYNSGSIQVSGSPHLDPHLQGLLFLADRDLVISGNPDITGFVAAHEQVSISGNPTLVGSVVGEDAAQLSPLVVGNSISGNPTITYNGELPLPLSALLRVTAWTEL